MKYLTALLLASVALVSSTQAAEWEYPTGDSTGLAKQFAGKAGRFDSYEIATQDSPEKVVLWYAKQLGLDEKHGLVQRAKNGFKIEKGISRMRGFIVRGTMAEELGGVYRLRITPENVNVQMFIRPESDATKDITVSITKLGKETLITVIQSVPKSDRK